MTGCVKMTAVKKLLSGRWNEFKESSTDVVLDYKTDRVRTADELVRRYQSQLTYYARALSQITGKAVKEKIIYSFALGKEINV